MGVLWILIGSLRASLLGNMLTIKGMLRAGYGNRKGKGILRAGFGKGMLRGGYGSNMNFNAIWFFNKLWNTEVWSE